MTEFGRKYVAQCMADTHWGRQCSLMVHGDGVIDGIYVCHFHYKLLLRAVAREPFILEMQEDYTQALHELWRVQAEAERLKKVIARASRKAIPKTVRVDLIVQNEATCTYCRGVGDSEVGPDGRTWHIDHKHPVIEGGTNDIENLTLACARCNSRKHDKTEAQFRALLEREAQKEQAA